MASDAYQRGMKMRRKVLGDDWVDRAEGTKNAFNAEYQDIITRYAWDEIWTRPRLAHDVRRMIVIAQMVALGRWEEFKLHVGAALRSGDLEEEDVKEVLLQSIIYCGVPAANTAFKEAREVIEQLAAAPRGAKAGK